MALKNDENSIIHTLKHHRNMPRWSEIIFEKVDFLSKKKKITKVGTETSHRADTYVALEIVVPGPKIVFSQVWSA